ncbi:hypothetical protein [Dethiothermospora halolimnae]|uniref:hypothetical protein n=1 Tax=Dethiothermospora halolimnae TaxID=3114390 RepID=UPI003CCBD2F1
MKIYNDSPNKLSTDNINRDKKVGVKSNSVNNISSDSSKLGSSQIIKDLGFKETSELKKATDILLDNDIKINKNVLKDINKFISKSPGDIEDKLDTIKNLIKKDVNINFNNLKSTHQTLHGDDLNKLIEKVDKNSKDDLTEQKSNYIAGGKILDKVPKEVQNEIKELLKSNEDTHVIIKKIINKLKKLKLDNKTIKDIMKNILSNYVLNTDLDYSLEENIIENTIDKGGQLDSIQILDSLFANKKKNQLNGKESNYKEIENKKIVDREKVNESRNIEELLDLDKNNELRNALNNMEPDTKAYVMNKVTERMISAKNDFKELKREVLKNLDNILNKPKEVKQTPQHVKSILEDTINIIDKKILKSDISLFTDMKTEKKLLILSNKLSEARKHLSKGESNKTVKILNNIKDEIGKMDFKPKNSKIIHAATKESLFAPKRSLQSQIKSNIDNIINTYKIEDPTAKTAYNLLRAMGISHESEIAQKFLENPQGIEENKLEKNLKSLMMKLVNDSSGSKDKNIIQQVGNILDDVTGQQLLSKQEENIHKQSMFFNIPIQIGEKLTHVKLYINGKKKNEKIDWENTNLYFLLETDKMGETGIKISASNKNLNLTIKNDKSHLKDKVGSLSEELKENLEEIGYNTVGVNFSRLNENEVKEKREQGQIIEKNESKEGFDFRI